MTQHRNPVPTIPEIKDMEMSTLITQASRVRTGISRITKSMEIYERKADQTDYIRASKALALHEKGYRALIAEMAVRYEQGLGNHKKTLLFYLMGNVVATAKAFVDSQDEEERCSLEKTLASQIATLDGLR